MHRAERRAGIAGQVPHAHFFKGEFDFLRAAVRAIELRLPADRRIEPMPTLLAAQAAGPEGARRLLSTFGSRRASRQLRQWSAVIKAHGHHDDARGVERLAALIEAWDSGERRRSDR